MKKRNLTSLKLNKNRISTFDVTKIIVGDGNVNQTCEANTRARGRDCQFCEPQYYFKQTSCSLSFFHS